MSLHFPRIVPKGTKRSFDRNLTRRRKIRRSGDQFRVVRSSPRNADTSSSGVPHPVAILAVLVWVFVCIEICGSRHYLLMVFLVGLSVPAALIGSDLFDGWASKRRLRRRRKDADRRAVQELESQAVIRPMRLEPIRDGEEDSGVVDSQSRITIRPARRTHVDPPRTVKHYATIALGILSSILLTIVVGQVLIRDVRWAMLMAPQSLTLIGIGSIWTTVSIERRRSTEVRRAAED